MTGINAGARLDRLPLSKFHTRVLWLVGLGIFLDSIDISIQAPILGALAKAGWSTVAKNGYFISATFAGLALGSAIASLVGERLWRRFMYQFNLALFGLASILAAFAPSMEWLIGIRFIIGVGLGAELVVGYSVLAELMPPATRGRTVLYVGLLSMSGGLIAAVLGLLIIPTLGWRWLFGVVGIGALVVWYLRKALPESPRWLESVGRNVEGEQILSAIEAEVAQRAPLPALAATIATTPGPEPISVLFGPTVIRRTIVAIAINVAFGAGIYGFIQLIPTFLVTQGVSLTTSLGFNIGIQAGGVVGPIIGILVADRIGRKPLLIGAAFLSAIFGLLYPFVRSGPELVACGCLITMGLYTILSVGVALYLPELFPTQYRMLGTGVAQVAGRLTTIFVPYGVVAIYAAAGAGTVAVSLAGLLVVFAVIVAVLGIETKCATLEDLDPRYDLGQKVELA
jgi:MFS transporter, putative metabolite:H+ symporter